MTHHHFLPLAVSSHQPLFFFFFFLDNGANAQPCGQLTGRLGPYANFMMAETIVCSANGRNDVVFGAALILTLICGELLMINRVRDCFQCSPVGRCGASARICIHNIITTQTAQSRLSQRPKLPCCQVMAPQLCLSAGACVSLMFTRPYFFVFCGFR